MRELKVGDKLKITGKLSLGASFVPGDIVEIYKIDYKQNRIYANIIDSEIPKRKNERYQQMFFIKDNYILLRRRKQPHYVAQLNFSSIDEMLKENSFESKKDKIIKDFRDKFAAVVWTKDNIPNDENYYINWKLNNLKGYEFLFYTSNCFPSGYNKNGKPYGETNKGTELFSYDLTDNGKIDKFAKENNIVVKFIGTDIGRGLPVFYKKIHPKYSKHIAQLNFDESLNEDLNKVNYPDNIIISILNLNHIQKLKLKENLLKLGYDIEKFDSLYHEANRRYSKNPHLYVSRNKRFGMMYGNGSDYTDYVKIDIKKLLLTRKQPHYVAQLKFSNDED